MNTHSSVVLELGLLDGSCFGIHFSCIQLQFEMVKIRKIESRSGVTIQQLEKFNKEIRIPGATAFKDDQKICEFRIFLFWSFSKSQM